MSIFQKSVINKHLTNFDSDQVEKAYQKFREKYNSTKIEEIKKTTKKLTACYDFDFKTFIGQLKKQKGKITLAEQVKVEEFFRNY